MADQPRLRTTPAGPDFTVWECRRCSRTVVGLDPAAPGPQCHGAPMERVATADGRVTRVALGTYLADAFGIPESGTDVCYALLVDGIRSIGAVSERIDREPDTVRSHLERLVSAGLLECTDLSCPGATTGRVYHTTRGRPATLAEFCTWAVRAGDGSTPAVVSDRAGEPATSFREMFCVP